MNAYPRNLRLPLEPMMLKKKPILSLQTGKSSMRHGLRHTVRLKSHALGSPVQPSKIAKHTVLDVSTPMNSVPSAESIRSLESKGRPLEVEPWMAAHLSRVWHSIKVNLEGSIKKQVEEKKRSNRVAPIGADTQGQPRSGQ